MTEPVAVEQIDRDAAASLWLEHNGQPNSPHELAAAGKMRSGTWDDDDWVQAFARHRLAAIAQTKSPAVSEPVAWLIERDDLATIESRNKVALHYYAEWHGKHYWTPDHMQAKRFPDEASARAETNGDPLLRVAEHVWIGDFPHPAASERDQVDKALYEMAKVYSLGSPESRAIITAIEHMHAVMQSTPSPSEPESGLVERVARAIYVQANLTLFDGEDLPIEDWEQQSDWCKKSNREAARAAIAAIGAGE